MRKIATRYLRNKYGAKKTEYKGRVYASKQEAGYARILDLSVQGKLIKSVVSQVAFPITVQGVKIGRYTCDFLVTELDGTLTIVEVKGYETEAFKLRWKLIKALYQDQYKFELIKK